MNVQFPDFSIALEPDWFDVTHEVEGEPPPVTIAKSAGHGALQFSIANYVSGVVPTPSVDTLRTFLREFAEKNRLGAAEDICVESNSLLLVAASFRPDSMLRVWYVSDGRSFGFITFICDCQHAGAELPDCERMVRTIAFD